jgi:hypothetical protein
MDVVTNEKDEVVMLTVLASNGITYDVEPKEIEPDPLYLENIPGR